MKFKKLNGYIDDTSYISIEIEGGDSDNSIGDRVWISENELQISDFTTKEEIEQVKNLFVLSSQRAFIGALMRMGIL